MAYSSKVFKTLILCLLWVASFSVAWFDVLLEPAKQQPVALDPQILYPILYSTQNYYEDFGSITFVTVLQQL